MLWGLHGTRRGVARGAMRTFSDPQRERAHDVVMHVARAFARPLDIRATVFTREQGPPGRTCRGWQRAFHTVDAALHF